MAIVNTTKYKIFTYEQSADNGVTWQPVTPSKIEAMAWEENSIECGASLPIYQWVQTSQTVNCDGSTLYSVTEYKQQVSNDNGKTWTDNGVTSATTATETNSVKCKADGNLTYKIFSAPLINNTVTLFYTNSNVNDLPNDGGWFKKNMLSLSSLIVNGKQCIDTGFYGPTETNVTYTGTYGLVDSSTIGTCAFCECQNLDTIEIPTSVTKIDDKAFYGCDILTITYKGTMAQWKAIKKGFEAFWKPASLNPMKVECSDGTIDADTTESPTGITTGGCETVVTYMDGGTEGFSINGEILKSDIDYISAATKVDIGTCVTSIGIRTFSECGNLTSVSIPESVTSIGNSAFYYCYNLTSLSIPESVTSIGDNVFFASGISSLTYQGTTEQWDAISKGYDWQGSINEVYCSDGYVPL